MRNSHRWWMDSSEQEHRWNENPFSFQDSTGTISRHGGHGTPAESNSAKKVPPSSTTAGPALGLASWANPSSWARSCTPGPGLIGGVVLPLFRLLVAFLFLFHPLTSQAGFRSLVLDAGSRTPLVTVLEELRTPEGPEVILAHDTQAVVEARETTRLSLDQLLRQILPLNGFYTYRSPETCAVIITRDLVERRIPISREVNRGLRRAAAEVLGTTSAATFDRALEQVLLGDEVEEKLTIDCPERTLRLSARPSELVLRDTRHRARRIQEALARLGPELAKAPPVALVIETIPLERTTGQPYVAALDESLFGGTGFDGHSWDGTPFLAMDANSQVLVIGHTRSGIDRARELANHPTYKVPFPQLDLATRKYQAVPNKILKDLSISASHQRAQRVELIAKLFETILYERGGQAEALTRGRQIIPHPDAGTIDVIDTPENLQKIEEYLQYNGVSSAQSVAFNSPPSSPRIRVIEVKHRAIDQAARALGFHRYR